MTTNPTRKVELKINGSWVDVSSWVDVGPGGAAIVITRGRENEQADTQPGSCTFSLVNDDGRFSLDLPTGAYYPHFKKWIEVRVTVEGKRRFTGYMSDVETTLDDETGLHSHSAITCTDTLGIQAASPVATSWAADLISDLSPLYWWPMDDLAKSTVAAPRAGSVSLMAEVMHGVDVTDVKDVTDMVVFGDSSDEALEADGQVSLHSEGYGTENQFGRLVATIPALTPPFTIIMFARCPTIPTGATLFRFTDPELKVAWGPNSYIYFSSTGHEDNIPAAGILAAGKTALIAVSVTNGTAPSGRVSLYAPDGSTAAWVTHGSSYVFAGEFAVGGDSISGVDEMAVSNLAILPGVLSQAEYVDLRLKLIGEGEGPVSDWLDRSLSAASISGTSSTTTDRQMKRPQLKGSNPSAIGNALAKSCGGVYLADRDGTPKWLDPTYCPAWVEIPFDHIDPGVSRAPDQSLTYTEISVDGTPTASTGGWPKSELDIPGLLPDSDLAHYVRWLTNSADVWAEGRYSALTIDLLPLDSATTDTYLDVDVRSRVLPTAVPAQFPDGQVLTVEGLAEVITADTWTLTLNTAPDPRFVLGDTVAGVLGSNYRLFWT